MTRLQRKIQIKQKKIKQKFLIGDAKTVRNDGQGRRRRQNFRQTLEHLGRRQHDLDHPEGRET